MTPEAPQTPETPNSQAAPETLEIQDLNEFVRILVGWHSHQVRTLEHFLTLPEGLAMQVGEGPEVVLAGDMLAGFKAGIELSLMQLGKLPFSAELEDTPVPAPAAAAPDAPTTH